MIQYNGVVHLEINLIILIIVIDMIKIDSNIKMFFDTIVCCLSNNYR